MYTGAFLQSTKELLALHGSTCSYVRVQNSSYDVETSSVTSTETTVSIKAYAKHIRANQYNYPDLIGRDAIMFYIAGDALTFEPSSRDKIVFESNTYNVDSYQEHRAAGSIALYRVIAIKA